ncbi:hypothetical protein RU86_GL000242 [Lactococcus piscium]|uniref:Transposase n=1 Tax=Pseudolactococcus piscium TaxID=1364 RepID=A0A2A5RZE0_9LACT|nr:hypothetical protein RU86_GL000242 [Lactococcus piscium]
MGKQFHHRFFTAKKAMNQLKWMSTQHILSIYDCAYSLA